MPVNPPQLPSDTLPNALKSNEQTDLESKRQRYFASYDAQKRASKTDYGVIVEIVDLKVERHQLRERIEFLEQLCDRHCEHNSTLKAREVRTIVQLKGQKSNRKLAAMFGVSRSTIQKIMAGETWKHITAARTK